MKNDTEYKKYIESKSLSELLELIDQINKNASPARHKIILDRIEYLKIQAPNDFAETVKEKKYDTITRRIVSNIVDGAIMFALGWLIRNYVKDPLQLTENRAEALAFLLNVGYLFVALLWFGQSVGMRICEIKLLKVSEAKANILNVFLFLGTNVALLFILTLLTMQILGDTTRIDNVVALAFAAINIGTAAINKKHRALTDLCSQTVLVATKYVA